MIRRINNFTIINLVPITPIEELPSTYYNTKYNNYKCFTDFVCRVIIIYLAIINEDIC